MAILVLGKCSANFGRQILGKALQFPGKRLQISLPECIFTLDRVNRRRDWSGNCIVYPIKTRSKEKHGSRD